MWGGKHLRPTPGGTLDMGTAASPINASSATLILSSGTFAGQYGLVVNNGGNFLVYGAAKTPVTTATSSVFSGVGTLTLNDLGGMNWAAGDVITIGKANNSSVDEDERVTITSIASWPTISFTPSTTYGHFIGTAPIRVGDLTRNVLVSSSGNGRAGVAATPAYVETLTRERDQL